MVTLPPGGQEREESSAGEGSSALAGEPAFRWKSEWSC